MHWSTAVFSAMLALGRLTQTICGGLVLILKKKIGGTVPDSHLYYGHSLPVSIVHWCNAALLAILLLSGLNIFNAHTALYWGKSSYSGLPRLGNTGQRKRCRRNRRHYQNFRPRIPYTGLLGASKNSEGELTARGFPSWLTIPDGQWLSLARRWHFFMAWVLVINGLAFVPYSIVSGH